MRNGTAGSDPGTVRTHEESASNGPVASVAIQDRSRFFRKGLEMLLNAHSGLRVTWVTASPASIWESREHFDGVILEVPDRSDDDLELTRWIRETDPAVVIIGTFPEIGRPPCHLDGLQLIARNSPAAHFASILKGGDGGGVYSTFRSDRRMNRASDNLTTRELQVLALIGGGLTSKQIAQRLGISVKTVESKRQAMFGKLGVQNQASAVAVGMRRGLLGVGAPRTADTRSS